MYKVFECEFQFLVQIMSRQLSANSACKVWRDFSFPAKYCRAGEIQLRRIVVNMKHKSSYCGSLLSCTCNAIPVNKLLTLTTLYLQAIMIFEIYESILPPVYTRIRTKHYAVEKVIRGTLLTEFKSWHKDRPYISQRNVTKDSPFQAAVGMWQMSSTPLSWYSRSHEINVITIK